MNAAAQVDAGRLGRVLGNFLDRYEQGGINSPGLRPPQELALPYTWGGSWPHLVEKQATLYCDRGDCLCSVLGCSNDPGVEVRMSDWGELQGSRSYDG